MHSQASAFYLTCHLLMHSQASLHSIRPVISWCTLRLVHSIRLGHLLMHSQVSPIHSIRPACHLLMHSQASLHSIWPVISWCTLRLVYPFYQTCHLLMHSQARSIPLYQTCHLLMHSQVSLCTLSDVPVHTQCTLRPTKLPVEHMTSAWFKSPSRDHQTLAAELTG